MSSSASCRSATSPDAIATLTSSPATCRCTRLIASICFFIRSFATSYRLLSHSSFAPFSVFAVVTRAFCITTAADARRSTGAFAGRATVQTSSCVAMRAPYTSRNASLRVPTGAAASGAASAGSRTSNRTSLPSLQNKSPTHTVRAPAPSPRVRYVVWASRTRTPSAGSNVTSTFWAATLRRPPRASAKARGMFSSFSMK
mmetsp:Transcript_7045/g.17504  ORF Transcript_7045/g.17504 Transcript_7045/m.17504 type:complete len:200 (-) Transcript_7045:222-821(-)